MDELFAQNQTQEPRYMYDENDVLIEAPPVPASDALKRGMFSIANLFGLYPRTEEEKRAAANVYLSLWHLRRCRTIPTGSRFHAR